MKASEKLFQLIQILPENQINEVLNFAEFLHQKRLSTRTGPQDNANRANAIQTMRGLLKTEQPAPTDQEVAALLEDRRRERYLP